MEWEVAKDLSQPNLNIQIEPRSGTLKQGQTQQLFVEVFSGALPAVFLEDIPFKCTFIRSQHKKTAYGVVTDGRTRLPAILANTVSSAARISETAIL